ncbi:MAG: matrixin family metalloprotease [Planctomycetaceae bacterium]
MLESEITRNHDQTSFRWTLGPSAEAYADGCELEIGDDAAAASHDLYSVLLHEIGHGLGCSHPNNRCKANDPCSFETMCSCTDSGEYGRRALDPGDRLSISRLYGSQP